MEITIDDLCKKLKGKLQDCQSLAYFYIGKTSDIEKRTQEHEKNGYHSTTPLAEASYSLISKTEKRLIEYFKSSSLCEKCANVKDESTGRKTSENKKYVIYVSVKISPSHDYELEDDDLNWNEVYKLKTY